MSNQINILLPFNSVVTPISESTSIQFKNKMLGDGVTILPTTKLGIQKICAPIDGKIKYSNSMPHIMIFSNEEFSVILHVGSFSSKLSGRGFGFYASPEQEVKAGEEIAFVDFEFLNMNSSLESALTIKMEQNKESNLNINYSSKKQGQIVIKAEI